MKFFPYENFFKKILIFGNTIIFVFFISIRIFYKNFIHQIKNLANIWLFEFKFKKNAIRKRKYTKFWFGLPL